MVNKLLPKRLAVHAPERIFVLAEDEDLLRDEEPHAVLLRWQAGEWVHLDLDFWAVDLCLLPSTGITVLVLGADGTVAEVPIPGAANRVQYAIDADDEGSSALVQMRAALAVGHSALAVGMARHAYRRRRAATWDRIDSGLFVPRSRRSKASGLNAVAGTSGEHLCAVGYGGEIWTFDGRTWQQVDSPTNIVLNDVLLASEDTAYACGMAGTLLRGGAAGWAALDIDLDDEDFWSMAEFRRRLYVASGEALFRLRPDGQLERLALPPGGAAGFVAAGEAEIWSVGQESLLRSPDGDTWTELALP